MVKAIVSCGQIRPLEPTPADWREGQALRIEKVDYTEMPADEIDREFDVLASLCSESEPANENQLDLCAARSPPSRQGARSSGQGARLVPDDLLDCNHLAAALREVSAVREPIHQGRKAGERFISCYPVPYELEVGIQQTPKPDDNRRRLNQSLRHVRLWPLDGESTRLYELDRSFSMSADTDRHLLFGLIALQVGLIDQAQLVAAFQAWVRDKSRPLADHLSVQGSLDADGRGAVEAMAALHARKHGGDAVRSLAAIPASRAIHEQLAAVGDPELTVTISRCARLGRTTRRAAVGETVGSATSDGQRFRILRPHAKGGLGAVFVALDVELNREVALKQILDSHADDPLSRHRFLMEAEITGGLEHPGIVPVYGLGTYADGRPYYAMRFVRGESLKEAIDRFHKDAGLKKESGAGRWNCASSCDASSTSATRSSTCIRGVSCTAT